MVSYFAFFVLFQAVYLIFPICIKFGQVFFSELPQCLPCNISCIKAVGFELPFSDDLRQQIFSKRRSAQALTKRSNFPKCCA